MDQKCIFKLKGGLNFLCAAAGISLLTNAVIKLCKYGDKAEERKTVQEAVKAVKTIDEIMKKLDKYETNKTESEEESK